MDDEGPAPGPNTIRCEFPCPCVACGRPTHWRARTFDIHVCSAACFEEARELLECNAPQHGDG